MVTSSVQDRNGSVSDDVHGSMITHEGDRKQQQLSPDPVSSASASCVSKSNEKAKAGRALLNEALGTVTGPLGRPVRFHLDILSVYFHNSIIYEYTSSPESMRPYVKIRSVATGKLIGKTEESRGPRASWSGSERASFEVVDEGDDMLALELCLAHTIRLSKTCGSVTLSGVQDLIADGCGSAQQTLHVRDKYGAFVGKLQVQYSHIADAQWNLIFLAHWSHFGVKPQSLAEARMALCVLAGSANANTSMLSKQIIVAMSDFATSDALSMIANSTQKNIENQFAELINCLQPIGLSQATDSEVQCICQDVATAALGSASTNRTPKSLKTALRFARAVRMTDSIGFRTAEQLYRQILRFDESLSLDEILDASSLDEDITDPAKIGLQLASDVTSMPDVSESLRYQVRDKTVEHVLCTLFGKDHPSLKSYEREVQDLLLVPGWSPPAEVQEQLSMIHLYSGDPPDASLDFCGYMKSRILNQPPNLALFGRLDVVAVPVTADYDDGFQKCGGHVSNKSASPLRGKGWFWVLHAAALNIGENEQAEDFQEYTFKYSSGREPTGARGLCGKTFWVAPYGVLGTQLARRGRVIEDAGPEPDGECVIVDPAGLPFIQKMGPQGAAGASGALYKWLRLKEFPQEVSSSVTEVTDAKFYEYPQTGVIHVVGPDLRDGQYTTEDSAIEALTIAYSNVLHEFAKSRKKRLRLLPISSSIFAGRYKRQMSMFTFVALKQAIEKANPGTLRALQEADVEMCIFEEEELEAYEIEAAHVGFIPFVGKQGQLDEERYKSDMAALWNVAFQAAVKLRVQHLIVFPFGMGAFLRNLHKCDPQYNDDAKIRAVRRCVADGLAEAVAAVAAPASLRVHLCLVHADSSGNSSPEAVSNHNVLLESLGEKAKANPKITNLLQIHRNLDALRLASDLSESCNPSGKDGVQPVALLNGANKKLLGNHWFSHGARFAIDENLHRRSSSMATASLLLNGGAQPRHRGVHELHNTVRFLGGKVINVNVATSPQKDLL